jgi:hypothetical protein
MSQLSARRLPQRLVQIARLTALRTQLQKMLEKCADTGDTIQALLLSLEES